MTGAPLASDPTDPVPVAFYAPLKSPHHPTPSGDRTMARLLLKALRVGGFEPSLASEIRTLDKAGDPAVQAAIRARCEAEADRLVVQYRALPPAAQPRLWFTYHVYYKAPDWIGPRVAEALGIPYAVAEGSRSAKRATGPWALSHSGAEAALDRADAVFVMTLADREALARAKPGHQRLVDLPPFLDDGAWNPAPVSEASPDGPVRLLVVAMMRAGDKLRSYRILAEALARLADRPWILTLVGDGEARAEVEALFAPFGERVVLAGQVEGEAMPAHYRAADLFIWPAVNEAYGMAFLEAQAFGCPVVAGAYGGVASVVQDGRTGLLTPPGDVDAFAAALRRLIENADERRALGGEARRFVGEERGLNAAARRLREGLQPLLPEARP